MGNKSKNARKAIDSHWAPVDKGIMETEMIPPFAIPAWVVEELRPHALLAGCNSGKCSIVRWAAIRMAEKCRQEKADAAKQPRVLDATG